MPEAGGEGHGSGNVPPWSLDTPSKKPELVMAMERLPGWVYGWASKGSREIAEYLHELARQNSMDHFSEWQQRNEVRIKASEGLKTLLVGESGKGGAVQ